MGHCSQRGFLATQVLRPCQMRRFEKWVHSSFRDDLHQVELNLDRIIILRQTNPLTYSMDMGIHHDPGYSKGIPQDDIGSLSSHTGQGHQFVQGFWNLSFKAGHQLLTAFLDGFRLISDRILWAGCLPQIPFYWLLRNLPQCDTF